MTNTIDPLGGSYFVEALTDELEGQAYAYFDKIDELGGMVDAVKRNYPQREIAEASFRYQQEVDGGRRKLVGVNAYTEGDDAGGIPILRIDPALERKQVERLERARANRDDGAADRALAALRDAAADDGQNLMPALLESARAHCTEGEIVGALQTVFGTYTETPVF